MVTLLQHNADGHTMHVSRCIPGGGDDDNTVMKKGANIPVLTCPAGHASPCQLM